MSAAPVIIEGVVKLDGTLELSRKLNLPAGRVQVTVQAVTEPVEPDRFWKMMESLWANRRAGGRSAPQREGGEGSHRGRKLAGNGPPSRNLRQD